MSEKSSLMEFQDALMELLSSGLPYEEALERLASDPRFEEYRDYVKGFDPDMVAVASELVLKWAKFADAYNE